MNKEYIAVQKFGVSKFFFFFFWFIKPTDQN